jgi:microsomal dipeptidase-like Zn-dependent dipeptidase
METVIKFIKEKWFIMLPWFFAIAFLVHIIVIHNKTRPILPPIDNRVDSLEHIVDSLNISYIKLQQDYDSAQSNVKIDIQKIYIKNAKDISNIRNYTLNQRDSVWSTLNP